MKTLGSNMAPVSSLATAGMLQRLPAPGGILQLAGQTQVHTPHRNHVNSAPTRARLHALKWNATELFKCSSEDDNQLSSTLRHGTSHFKGNVSELLQANTGSSKFPLAVFKSRVCTTSSKFHGDPNSLRQARIRQLNQLYNKLDNTGATDSPSSTSKFLLTSK